LLPVFYCGSFYKIFEIDLQKFYKMNNVFIHHVFFWLKEPTNQLSKQQLIEGLQKLSKVTTIKTFHIGQPAATNREVIDATYAVSWMLTFATAADQDSYQVDPIHLNFVKECAHLWDKVVVYDTVDV
jgi:Stress responsive A/B Barrel Domain